MVTSEWQGVVLCGGAGNRMTELTDHIPKCMLPVASVPMFWYPLNFLQRNSVKDVLLIVNEKQLGEVKLLLIEGGLPPLEDLNIEIVACCNDDYGTADVLRQFANKIKKDFIVVSGDFISDMNLEPVFSLHRAENSAITCVFADSVVTGPVPGPKIKRSKGRDLVALSQSNQLLFMTSEEDIDDSVLMNTNLFSKYNDVNLTAKYNDCHVYLVRKWILDIAPKERNISSIKADLIPYFLEKQYTEVGADIAGHIACGELISLSNQFSCGKTEVGKFRCFAYLITPENGTIIAHANNLGSYFEVNKAIVRFLWTRFTEKFPKSLSTEKYGDILQVSESYINQSVRITNSQPVEDSPVRNEKIVKIKRSIVGANTSVGTGAQITNSLIMDCCTIGPGAIVSNSILCDEVEVEEGAVIISSIVKSRQKITCNYKVEKELVAPTDEMEIED